jgi:4-hydroxyphenylpyruvate dioxygenase
MSVKLNGIDSIDFSVKSIPVVEKSISGWGFSKLGEKIAGSKKESLWGQGKIRLLLTESTDPDSETSKYVAKHGDGISNISFQVDDAHLALEEVASRGAKVLSRSEKEELSHGELRRSSVSAMGDVKHTFISRHGTDAFSSSFSQVSDLPDFGQIPNHGGLFAVDHITCNLPAGELDQWAEFYEKIFGFKNTRFFDINTGRTGLHSKVMENAEGTVKIPMNEPTDKRSQIQEYLDVNNGPGVQHLAFATGDILKALPTLRSRGQQFLEVPDSYYDVVPKRVKGIREDLDSLKQHRILADGEASGYLLQIFSQNVVGPFFYEVIQRCGNKGFGEGNFRALFEAIERDQELRGVL